LLSTIQRLPASTRVDSTRLGPVPAERVDLPGLDQQRVLLYLHGGGYTTGSPRTHRALVAHLAASAGRPAFTLDYRLAPEHPFPAAVDDAEAAYHALLRAGFRATDIAVAGDSAGGGLAVSLALRLRDQGVALPACLALISPWVDLTLSDPSTRNDRRDVLLRTVWLEQSAADYAGADRSRPEVSPAFADLRGLPPVTIHVGTTELLRADADRLAAELVHDGVPVDVRRLDDMWHVWHLHAGLVAAPTRAVRELGAFIRTAASPGEQP
jgi:acetyl esterase/lipase